MNHSIRLTYKIRELTHKKVEKTVSVMHIAPLHSVMVVEYCHSLMHISRYVVIYIATLNYTLCSDIVYCHVSPSMV